MINKEQDVNKKAIVRVRDRRTGRLVWRNFGFRVAGVNGNGQVILVDDRNQTMLFHINEVKVIDQ
jgi:hypothetical protein